MKIAFFTDTYLPHLNGVATSVAYFSKYLRAKGYKILIFAPTEKGYLDKDRNTYRISSVQLMSKIPETKFPFVSFKKSWLKAFKIDSDLIHAHGNGPFSLLGYFIARQKNIPFILTFHTFFDHYAHYFLDGKVLRPKHINSFMSYFANLCNLVITPSEKMKLQMIKLGVKKPIEVVPNFVDIDKFSGGKKNYLHDLCKIDKDKKILLSVGRLGKEKNFKFLIDLFSKMAEDHPEVDLVIVGQGVDKEDLIEQTQKLKIESRVHIIGGIERELMNDVYSSAYLFTLASTSETQGIVCLEAAAAELPLVLVDDSAFNGIIEDNFNGYSLPLDQKIFIEKVSYLIKNPDKAKEMGKNSKKLVRKNFSSEAIIEKLTAIYAKVLIESKQDSELILSYGHPLSKEEEAFLHEDRIHNRIIKYEVKKLDALRKETEKKLEDNLISEIEAENIFRKIEYFIRKLYLLNKTVPLYNSEIVDVPKGVDIIKVETPETGKVAIRSITINTSDEHAKDQIPFVFITGWSNDFKSPAAYVLSLAILTNRPVIVFSMPEHFSSIRPKDWGERLKRTGDHTLHAKLFIQIFKDLNIKEMDLQGQSVGGAVVLTIAKLLNEENNQKIKIRNLDIFNPTGFQAKSWPKIIYDFLISGGIQTLMDKDLIGKTFIVQRNPLELLNTGAWQEMTAILTKKLFNLDYLLKIKVAGHIRLFFGDNDTLIQIKHICKDILNIKNNPECQIETIKIKGGHHGMLLSKSAFFASLMNSNQPLADRINAQEIPANLADLI